MLKTLKIKFIEFKPELSSDYEVLYILAEDLSKMWNNVRLFMKYIKSNTLLYFLIHG